MILFVIIELFCRLLIVKTYKVYCPILCELLQLFLPLAATPSASRRAPPAPRSRPDQATGHHAQRPAPQPRHHHGQTITEGDGHGQQPRGRATRSTAGTDGQRRNAPAPRAPASRSTPAEPPPVSQPTGPEPSSPARLPSMLYPVQIDGERSRQGERERGRKEGAAPAHLENRRHSYNIELWPPCAPPAVTGYLEPLRSCFRTPRITATPSPFQFCFWRENRTGPKITPNIHGRTAPPAPPRPP